MPDLIRHPPAFPATGWKAALRPHPVTPDLTRGPALLLSANVRNGWKADIGYPAIKSSPAHIDPLDTDGGSRQLNSFASCSSACMGTSP